MAKLKAMGTSIKYAPAYNSADNLVKIIGALTSIGEIAPTSDEVDSTTLDSPNGYREFLQGMKDSGELPLSGYHDAENEGQNTMRTLFASGASGYFWVTFPDQTTVAFTAYVKGYSDGAADVDGIVGFGCTLRISGFAQVISTAYENVLDVLDATATVLTGTPAYQWYECDDAAYTNPSDIVGATSATYNTASAAGFYYCAVTVPNYRPVNSQIFTVA
jgi:predicted secreted protein